LCASIGQWRRLEARAHQRKLESNFVALNREAVKSGLVTTAEHQAFRNTHKIWRYPVNEGRVKTCSPHLPPGTTYGICTRPSTPIYDLIEHKYQRLWLEQQEQASEALRIMSKEKIQLRKVQSTRTSLLRRYQPPADPAPLWKLPRFDKVGPHLDTFPSDKARQRAISAHQSDAIARQGLHGQGIYNIS
ncbi:hypothetical protein GDO81_028655, partial [Engystomops pustulosus]